MAWRPRSLAEQLRVPNEMCLIMAYTTLRLRTCCHEGWTLVQQMMPVSLRVLLVQWGVMSCSRLEVTLTQPGLPGTMPRNPSPLRMHQCHKAGDEPVPVLFLFPCALPSCQGINFRFEIVRKSVPDSRSPGQCCWLWGFHHKIQGICVFSLKKQPPLKSGSAFPLFREARFS